MRCIGRSLARGGAATLFVGGKDHFADSLDTVALEEHVLCAAETDTLRAEVACLFCIAGCQRWYGPDSW